jgi:hypothetical protein
MLKRTGNRNKVAAVENNNPPITARPNGAFCSPPSLKPNAVGNMPTIIANAVINIGRKRTLAAIRAAARAPIPQRRLSEANIRRRIPLAVATPRLITAPMRAGTLSVVPVMRRIEITPVRDTGKTLNTISGSNQL